MGLQWRTKLLFPNPIIWSHHFVVLQDTTEKSTYQDVYNICKTSLSVLYLIVFWCPAMFCANRQLATMFIAKTFETISDFCHMCKPYLSDVYPCRQPGGNRPCSALFVSGVSSQIKLLSFTMYSNFHNMQRNTHIGLYMSAALSHSPVYEQWQQDNLQIVPARNHNLIFNQLYICNHSWI